VDKREYGAIKSSNIIGQSVLSAENEDLGKIKDIVLDKKNGTVLYVVLSFGDSMHSNNKLYALPWSSIDYDIVKQGFRLIVHKDVVTSTRCFQNDQWADFNDPLFHLPVTTNGLS